MRLKGTPSKKQNSTSRLLFIGAVVLAVIVILLLLGGRLGNEDYFFCDMEDTVNSGKNYRSNGHDFTNGLTQSSEYALNGKYSARCDVEGRQYGPGVTLRNIYSGDILEAKVWRKGDFGHGTLAVQGIEGWKFFTGSKEPDKIVGDWELLKVEVTVPLGVENRAVKIFPYATQGVVYFDDLEIRRKRNALPITSPSTSYVAEKLNLEVDARSFAKFRKKRAEALSRAVLIAGDEDLEPGKLKTEEGEIDVKARLKGDLTDHLQGLKWSFRILSQGQKSWRGMPQFSVHNSLSRSHLDEWMYHQILEREDVLTTRYDFIEMAMNGKTLGVYAYEEHFTPTLLRHRQRQVAPIVRWNEDGLWLHAGKGFDKRPPWFESAQIEAYGGKSIRKDNDQSAYFETARNLLASAIEGTKTPAEIFDLQRMASFLAVTDLCLGHHSLNQTNMRFYFNPVTAKLEPIGYDGYTPNGTRFYKLPMLTGSKINSRTPQHFSTSNDYNPLHHTLFNNFEFAEKYAAAVELVTAPEYLDNLKFQLKNEMEAREQFIRLEYTEYFFDFDYLTRNAKEIRKVLYPLENISLKAYLSEGQITLESYHLLPLEIMGFGDDKIEVKPDEKLVLESFNETVPVRRYTFPIGQKAKYVFCKTLGTSKLVKVPLMRWAAPNVNLPSPDKGSMGSLFTFDFVNVSADGAVRIAPGRHVLDRDFLVPAGHTLFVPPGTELVLENRAGIVSHSPIEFMGTPDLPVLITSDNRTGQGVLVIGAVEKSILRHVIFENLNARDKNGQRTEAAVLFYETAADLKHCQFLHAQSKDALAFIRSNYELDRCRFASAAADGLDADFSTGNILNLTFEKMGKDAIEISGGTADIASVTVDGAFGLGLNVNHHASVTAQKVDIINAQQGVAAIDLANLKIEHLTLNEVKQGVLAFQKIPEFGGGTVEVKNLETINVPEIHLLEEGSSVKIKGEEMRIQ